MLSIWLSCVLVLILSFSAGAMEWTFEPINFPNSVYTIPQDLNDNGDVVGAYLESEFAQFETGFVMRRGEFAPFDVIDFPAIPFAINKRGVIAGNFFDPARGEIAFVKNKNTVTEIGEGAPRADGVNVKGAVVGYRSVGPINQLAYLYKPGKKSRPGIVRSIVTPEDIADILGSAATGINDRGAVVGYFFFDSGECCFEVHGFLRRSNGELFTVDAPFDGATDTFPLGVNTSGDIVGLYTTGNDCLGCVRSTDSFFYDGLAQAWQQVTKADASGLVVLGINNKRQIVGYYSDVTTGLITGFFATPVVVGKQKK